MVLTWEAYVFLMFFLAVMAALFMVFAFMKWKVSFGKRDLQPPREPLLAETEVGRHLIKGEGALNPSPSADGEAGKPDQGADLVRFNPWLEMEGTFTLPLDLLFRVAQQDRILRAQTIHTKRVDMLVERIQRDGVLRPAVITVSRDGKLVLQDGHHLLVAANILELTHLPCKLQVSDNGIKIPSQLVSDLLEELLLAANTH